mmetsp:Transcript_99011/g.314300  ORF Transcript_99011/g.314300 Transcript_99011/m.314300 type:complete len:552 (+) Transcript_99011:190-1845(+)
MDALVQDELSRLRRECGAITYLLVVGLVRIVEGHVLLLDLHRDDVHVHLGGRDDLYQDPRPVQDLLGQQQHEVSALADVLLQLAEVGQVLRVEENGRLHVVAWVELVLQDHPLEGLLHKRGLRACVSLVVGDEHEVLRGVGRERAHAPLQHGHGRTAALHNLQALLRTAVDFEYLLLHGRSHQVEAEDVRALPVVVEAPDEDPGVPHGVAVGRGVPCENRGEGADIHGKHRSVAERLELAAVLPSGPEGGLRDEVPVVQHNIGNAAVAGGPLALGLAPLRELVLDGAGADAAELQVRRQAPDAPLRVAGAVLPSVAAAPVAGAAVHEHEVGRHVLVLWRGPPPLLHVPHGPGHDEEHPGADVPRGEDHLARVGVHLRERRVAQVPHDVGAVVVDVPEEAVARHEGPPDLLRDVQLHGQRQRGEDRLRLVLLELLLLLLRAVALEVHPCPDGEGRGHAVALQVSAQEPLLMHVVGVEEIDLHHRVRNGPHQVAVREEAAKVDDVGKSVLLEVPWVEGTGAMKLRERPMQRDHVTPQNARAIQILKGGPTICA